MKRNQAFIIKYFSKTRDKFCDHILGEDDDRVEERRRLLAKVRQWGVANGMWLLLLGKGVWSNVMMMMAIKFAHCKSVKAMNIWQSQLWFCCAVASTNFECSQ